MFRPFVSSFSFRDTARISVGLASCRFESTESMVPAVPQRSLAPSMTDGMLLLIRSPNCPIISARLMAASNEALGTNS